METCDIEGIGLRRHDFPALREQGGVETATPTAFIVSWGRDPKLKSAGRFGQA